MQVEADPVSLPWRQPRTEGQFHSRLRTILSPAPRLRRVAGLPPGIASFQPAASSQMRPCEHPLRTRMPAVPGRPRPRQAHRTGLRFVRNQEVVWPCSSLPLRTTTGTSRPSSFRGSFPGCLLLSQVGTRIRRRALPMENAMKMSKRLHDLITGQRYALIVHNSLFDITNSTAVDALRKFLGLIERKLCRKVTWNSDTDSHPAFSFNRLSVSD